MCYNMLQNFNSLRCLVLGISAFQYEACHGCCAGASVHKLFVGGVYQSVCKHLFPCQPTHAVFSQLPTHWAGIPSPCLSNKNVTNAKLCCLINSLCSFIDYTHMGYVDKHVLLGRFNVYNLPSQEGDAMKFFMMTSSNGNIFRVTGHLCGEFTGPRWIPHTKARDAEFWCFPWSASE